MKNLKHVVFALLISFLFIVNVSAKTTYKCNDGDEYYGSGMCRAFAGYKCPDGYSQPGGANSSTCIKIQTVYNRAFYNAENSYYECQSGTTAVPNTGQIQGYENNIVCQKTTTINATGTKKYNVYKAQVVTTSNSSSSSSSSSSSNSSSSSKSTKSKKSTAKKKSSSIKIECLDKEFNVDKEKQKVLPVFIKNKNNKPVSVSTGSKKIKVELIGNYIYVTGLKKTSAGKNVNVKVKVGNKSVKCPVVVNKKDTQTVELNNAESEANKVLSDSPKIDSNGTTSPTETSGKELKKITCNGTTTVKVGKTKKIKIKSKPKNSNFSNVNVVVKKGKKKIKITSSPNPTKVKGLAKGSAKVTFKYNGKITTCNVKVTGSNSKATNSNSNRNNSKKVKSIKIEGAGKITVGDKRTYIAYVSPSKADQKVKWSTSDKTKATINQSGQLVAKKNGTVTITATSKSNSKIKKTKKITIKKKSVKNNNNGSIAKSISIPSKKQISVNEKTKLKVTYDPSGSKTGVKFKSSNKKIATVDSDGTVIGHKKGNATITATYTADKNIKAECQIVVTKKIKLKSVSVSPKKVTLKEGEKKTVVATVSPASVSNPKVTWKSSKPKVASVNSNGQITAKKKGNATITAVSKMDSSKKASIKVTVKKNNEIVSTIIPLSVTANPSEFNMYVGQKKKINITTGAKNYKFKSSNKKIVTIDTDGTITGQKVGTTIITATHNADSKLTARITINVSEKKNVKKVQITALEGSVEVGDSIKLGVDVQPTDASNKGITWSSSDNKIASVSKNGKVTGKSKGNVKITATSKSDKTKKSSIKINVVKKGQLSNMIPLTNLKINEQDITLVSGSTQTLSLLKEPVNATSKISWTSSNNKVVTVNKNGKLKGYKAGTATITAGILTGDKMIAATTKVTVVPKADGTVENLKVKGIKLNKTKLTLTIDKSFGKATIETFEKLKVSFKPTGASGTGKLKWSSSNKKVASVSSDGTVTSHKTGDAVITVKYGKYSAKCNVKVKKYVSNEKKNEKKSTTKKNKKKNKSGWNWTFIDGDESSKKKKKNKKSNNKVSKNDKYIFIGDSRTVGMKSAVASNKNDIWSAKVGEGYTWMKNTGVPAVEDKIGKNSKVVILMGVNDLNSNAYITYLNSKSKKWVKKGATVYFVSVNPVDEEKARSNGYTITNKSIETFNKAMKNGLSSDIKYINTYSKINSFGTTDGLHYTNETYKKIYNCIKGKNNSDKANKSSSSKKTSKTNDKKNVKKEDKTENLNFTWEILENQELITINETSEKGSKVKKGNVSLYVDRTYTIKVNINGANFSSSDSSIVKIDANGNFSPSENGTITITIKDSKNAIVGELTLNILDEPDSDETPSNQIPENPTIQPDDSDNSDDLDEPQNSSSQQENNQDDDDDDE